MPRHINLRQIEAFKAVIENGTVSRAAELLNVSQPAMSKMIAHLEFDAGIKLFERHKKRLVPTERALRLYDEVGRIFAGVRQIENALEAIHREDQSQLTIGVMPALAGSFIQRGVTSFLAKNPNVFCSVQSLNSQRILDWLTARKLDVGLVDAGLDNPYVESEPLMKHPLVCIMKPDHPLALKKRIQPTDLSGVPFIRPHVDTYVGARVEAMFEAHEVDARVVLVANLATTVCEFVAAGVGISLVPPLSISGMEHRIIARPFVPEILHNFQLCRSADSRNAGLIDAFAAELRETAQLVSRAVMMDH